MQVPDKLEERHRVSIDDQAPKFSVCMAPKQTEPKEKLRNTGKRGTNQQLSSNEEVA